MDDTQKRLMIMAAALMTLNACQSGPQSGVEIREVLTPVPIACPDSQTAADHAAAEPPKVKEFLTGNAAVDALILAESLLLVRAWGQDGAAIIEGCAGK